MSYDYPLDYSVYNKEEIVKIIDFLAYLEDNLKSLDTKTLKLKYNAYKKTINSISEEKRINKEFYELSGISIYEIVKRYAK